jgi:hypothetical protein
MMLWVTLVTSTDDWPGVVFEQASDKTTCLADLITVVYSSQECLLYPGVLAF